MSFISQKALEGYPLSVKVQRINDENKILQTYSNIEHQENRSQNKYYIELRLIVDNADFFPPRQTKMKTGNTIDETIHFMIEGIDRRSQSIFSYLPYTTLLSFSIWSMDQEYSDIPLGSTTISLFDERLNMRQGKYTLVIWPNTHPDISFESKTPGLVDDQNINELQDYVRRQNKVTGQNASFLEQKALEGLYGKVCYLYKKIPIAFLEIEFLLTLDERIPYEETFNVSDCFSGHDIIRLNNRIYFNPEDCFCINMFYKDEKFSDLIVVRDFDNDLGREDPVKKQYLEIMRSDGNAHELRPNLSEKSQLEKILKRPNFNVLSLDEKNLVWKFRYFLKENGTALPKFLNAVNWLKDSEIKEALNMMTIWETPLIDDGLYLLSRDFPGNDHYTDDLTYRGRERRPGDKMQEIRKYAIEKILANQSSYEKLPFELVLLQLVQTLRYENWSTKNSSTLKDFLIKKCSENLQMASLFLWYLNVEFDNSSVKGHQSSSSTSNQKEVENWYKSVRDDFLEYLKVNFPDIQKELLKQLDVRKKLLGCSKRIKESQFDTTEKRKEELRKIFKTDSFYFNEPFVGHHLALNTKLSVLGVIPEECSIFKSAMAPLKISFQTVEREAHENKEKNRANHQEKSPQESKEEKKTFSIMYKNGDDLRQDQLVIQMICVMDNILKITNIDHKLTPYRVLAFSKSDGMLEFVPNSDTLQNVIKKYSSGLSNYFIDLAQSTYQERKRGGTTIKPQPKHADEKLTSSVIISSSSNEDKIFEEIRMKYFDNFIDSCAGYCVITYILGVGDRHLENLLLEKTGKLFHIDFGFILGTDPKISPPPFKLCPPMVEAMGGLESPGYKKFEQKCVGAYIHIRQYAKLILNLIYLMVDSGIDIFQKGERKEIMVRIAKLVDKFKLEETEEAAEQYFISLIHSSVDALFSRVFDKLHEWRQYWKT